LQPFGWSFDQILLLPAVLQMIYWRRALSRPPWLDAGLVALYVVPFVMRLAQWDEFGFAWAPWLALWLYVRAARQAGHRSQRRGDADA